MVQRFLFFPWHIGKSIWHQKCQTFICHRPKSVIGLHPTIRNLGSSRNGLAPNRQKSPFPHGRNNILPDNTPEAGVCPARGKPLEPQRVTLGKGPDALKRATLKGNPARKKADAKRHSGGSSRNEHSSLQGYAPVTIWFWPLCGVFIWAETGGRGSSYPGNGKVQGWTAGDVPEARRLDGGGRPTGSAPEKLFDAGGRSQTARQCQWPNVPCPGIALACVSAFCWPGNPFPSTGF